MTFKEYKEMINKTWDEWGRAPSMFVSTLNELFDETLDDCIIYPKYLFSTLESTKRMLLIFGCQRLYVIEFDDAFHEIKPFIYKDVDYVIKRESDNSIQVDLIIKRNTIKLNPLIDSNRHWEHKYHKNLIEIIKFLEKNKT